MQDYSTLYGDIGSLYLSYLMPSSVLTGSLLQKTYIISYASKSILRSMYKIFYVLFETILRGSE